MCTQTGNAGGRSRNVPCLDGVDSNVGVRTGKIHISIVRLPYASYTSELKDQTAQGKASVENSAGDGN